MWQQLVELDRELFLFLNSLWIDELDGFWLWITQVYNWVPLYFVFAYLLWKRCSYPKNWFLVLGMFITAFLTLTITNIVKNSIERLRPNNEPLLLDSIKVLQQPENFSFWSGHSAVSFAITAFVLLCLKQSGWSKWFWLFILWPILFAFSRIFVGVHYPSDIIAGMVVGIAFGYGSYEVIISITARDLKSNHP